MKPWLANSIERPRWLHSYSFSAESIRHDGQSCSANQIQYACLSVWTKSHHRHCAIQIIPGMPHNLYLQCNVKGTWKALARRRAFASIALSKISSEASENCRHTPFERRSLNMSSTLNCGLKTACLWSAEAPSTRWTPNSAEIVSTTMRKENARWCTDFRNEIRTKAVASLTSTHSLKVARQGGIEGPGMQILTRCTSSLLPRPDVPTNPE